MKGESLRDDGTPGIIRPSGARLRPQSRERGPTGLWSIVAKSA